jgi:Antibiotic biosynthesis monooxygenase
MLVLTRYVVAPEDEIAFLADADRALDSLRRRPGWIDATVGRATDDTSLWVIAMRWNDIGSYRRALNAYEVKVNAVPLLSRAVDEPTAFEVVRGDGATEPNRAQPRGSTPGNL